MNKKVIVRMPVLSVSSKTVEEDSDSSSRQILFESIIKTETLLSLEKNTEDQEEDAVEGMLKNVEQKMSGEQMEVFRLLENRFLQSSSVVIARKVMEKVLDLSMVGLDPLVRLECFLWARTVDPPQKTLERLDTILLPFLKDLTRNDHGQVLQISYVLGYVVKLFCAEDLAPVLDSLTSLCLPLMIEILCNTVFVSEDFRYRTMLDLRAWISKAAWTELVRAIWSAESPEAFGTETRLVWSQWLRHHPAAYDAEIFPALTEKVPAFLHSLLVEHTTAAPCHVADAAMLALDLPGDNIVILNVDLKKRAEDVLRDYYESGISHLYSYDTGRSVRTFYENKENIHCISLESAQEILDFLVEEFPIRARHRLQYYIEWIDRALLHWKDPKDEDHNERIQRIQRIHLALYRIDKDWSQHGRLRHRLYDIFQMVVSYIDKFGDKEKDHDRKELERRLLEELEEMSGTCSTGYAIRLLNVLTGYRDFQIRIPPEYALRCRLFQKLNSVISSIADIDPERAGRIMDQMTLPASCYDERTEFLILFREQLPQLKEELYQEFKDMMTDTDYDLYLRKAIFLYEGYLGGAGADF